ncbi:MAG: glycerol-3-phosphate 1-O-acyltransferase PlsY [Nitrospirota bacterium]
MKLVYPELTAIFIGYLLGSIPFGIIASRLIDGVDPRLKGSGNIGFTNVLRVAGKRSAIATLSGDVAKGIVPIFISARLGVSANWMLVTGIASVLGHCYSSFLRFKGGKGIATSFGVIFALQPLLAFISLFIWISVIYISRYSSLGSLLAFLFFPINIILFKKGTDYLFFSTLLLIILVIRHKENILRLMSGNENKIGREKK